MKYFLLLLTIVCAAVGAEVIPGRVIGVHDGDTLTLLADGKQTVKVRLHGIDAPESKQAFGSRAKQELSSLVFGKDVTVEVLDKDRYGRSVGRVMLGKVNINEEMVRRGFAWWYRAYAKGDKFLEGAEAEAKTANRGLWIDTEPVAPWQWRKTEVTKRKASK